MYRTRKQNVYPEDVTYPYFDNLTICSKNLKNASLYRIRNHFTASYKEAEDLTDNEIEVENEIKSVKSEGKVPKKLNYYFMIDLLSKTKNPDYKAENFPAQSAQQTVRKVCTDFDDWLKDLNGYKNNPSLYTGKPKMPKYAKSERTMAIITNQDAYIKDGLLKLPLTKEKLKVANPPKGYKLKEIQVKPCSGYIELLFVYEVDEIETVSTGKYSIGIDLGIDNLVAIVGNNPEMGSLLYKGGAIKSCNQYFNKRKSELTSILKVQCNKSGEEFKNSHKLNELSRYREAFILDYFHKIALDIIKKCETYSISKIVIGKTKFWKQNINIGKRNNQNFVSIPFCSLIRIIKYLAAEKGIKVIEQEESYTSKASFLDKDEIPVYSKNDETEYTFSGKRMHRGLYKSKEGVLLNADINGAGNTLRKYDKKSFDLIKDFSFVNNITVLRFNNFYKTKKVQ